MSNVLAGAGFALAAVAAGAAGWALMENRSLRFELEQRALITPRDGDPSAVLATPATAPAAAAATASEATVVPPEVARRFEAVEQHMALVREQVGKQEEAVAALVAAVTAPADGAPGGAPGAPLSRFAASSGETLEVVKRVARESVQAELAAQKGKDEKKPSLDQFGAILGLTDVQKTTVQREVVRGQQQLMDMLRTPAADGTVFLDHIVDAFTGKPEEAQPKMIQLFVRLTTEKFPGTEESYATRIETVKKSVTEAFRRDFTPAQFLEYQKMGQDPTEIQVEGGPWQEIMEQVQKRMAEKANSGG